MLKEEFFRVESKLVSKIRA